MFDSLELEGIASRMGGRHPLGMDGVCGLQKGCLYLPLLKICGQVKPAEAICRSC